jgi:hypothetical protein
MKTKRSARAELRKQLGKEAGVILRKVEKMLREGAPRDKIEEVLIAGLIAHTKEQFRYLGYHIDQVVG